MGEERIKEIFEREWLADERVRDLETLPWIKHTKSEDDDKDRDRLIKFVLLKPGRGHVTMVHYSEDDFEAPEPWILRKTWEQINQVALVRRNLEENQNGKS